MAGDRPALAAALRLLPGVASVEPAEGDAGGELESLLVRLCPGADRCTVEAAVGRVSAAHFGCTDVHERVRIVEAADTARQQLPPVPGPRSGRPQIHRTHVVTAGDEVNATVVLSSGSRTATGTSTGAVTGGGVGRAVATAVLHALDGLLPSSVRLELEHVQTQWGRDATVLVHVVLVSEAGMQRLTGAAPVRHDEIDAVVRATLDAANRRIEALLQ